MSTLCMLEAIQQGLAHALEHDNDVIVFGEDVGRNGGVFRATDGLQERFGRQRVFDSPLAENLIAGVSVGMSMHGLKPIAEFQFMGFIYAGLEQILNHASRMRHKTRGRFSCPLVYRVPYGGGIHAPEHHSESTEAIFAHIPGLRIVIPSSPLRAYGLLLSAIASPDPVLFMEPKKIYRLQQQEVPNDGQHVPLDRCFVLREGSDLSLVAWGAMIPVTMAAAEQLSAQGIEAEVIDVASIKPLDIDTILQSVNKTGRLVIVHEAVRTCGVGADIAAQVAETAFTQLLAPIQRVTGFDTIMPYANNEDRYLPSIERISKAVHHVLEYQ